MLSRFTNEEDEKWNNLKWMIEMKMKWKWNERWNENEMKDEKWKMKQSEMNDWNENLWKIIFLCVSLRVCVRLGFFFVVPQYLSLKICLTQSNTWKKCYRFKKTHIIHYFHDANNMKWQDLKIRPLSLLRPYMLISHIQPNKVELDISFFFIENTYWKHEAPFTWQKYTEIIINVLRVINSKKKNRE